MLPGRVWGRVNQHDQLLVRRLPVSEYPEPASGAKTKAAGVYRSYEDIFNSSCP
jgi:hypothetical protein